VKMSIKYKPLDFRDFFTSYVAVSFSGKISLDEVIYFKIPVESRHFKTLS
jgi:hypothetical protein